MKKITLVALMVTFSLSAFAQRGGERGPFLSNKFRDNWFISVGGGVNLYTGEGDRSVNLSRRIAPALDISLGKWITPAFGIRAQYAGLKAKGGSPYSDAPFVVGAQRVDKSDYWPKKFRYSHAHLDLMWNLSSTFGGYKPHRRWEFIPFLGFGPAWAKYDKSAAQNKHFKFMEWGVDAGLINKIRLTRALDLNIEARGTAIKQRFDGVSMGRKGEGMFSLTAGLGLKLGKKDFTKPKIVPAADYSAYNDRIRLLEGDLASSKSRADQLAKDLAAAKNAKPAAATEYVFPNTAIFFSIGSSKLSEKERVNIKYIAEAIKKLPAGSKVVLDGNADSRTGTTKGNQTLSERRAQVVFDALVAAGVNPAQLQKVAHGDKKEPFGHNHPVLNRVLIVEH